MKGFLFRVRRNGWLHGLVIVCLSVLLSLTIGAAFIAKLMLQFGMEQPVITARDEAGLIEWFWRHDIDSENAYDFLMLLKPVLVEMMQSLQFYTMLLLLYAFVLLFLFFYLMACAGYHGKEKAPCLRGVERIPYDLLSPCMIVLIICVCRETYESFRFRYYLEYVLIGSLCWLCVLIFSLLLFLMITIAKLRTRTLFSGMLIVRAGRLLLYFIGKIPSVWKAAAIWGGTLLFLHLFVFQFYNRWYYIDFLFSAIWTLIMVVLFFTGLWIIIQMDIIRRRAQALAEGGLEEESRDTKITGKKKRNCPMLPSFRKCLQDLNRISDGVNIAVEEKMKSERFQTELITNVSHDIKTPLTSIINYLDFLSQEEKKENRNPQVVQEYMEVLDRQSVRLKKLIEDLIEASKASTGSLNIQKEPCELGIFLQQIAGEYEERLEQAQLTLNLSLPEKGIYVEADGRYLWRVVDNLFQNACKYAMAGTRIYLQLQEKTGQAIIIMKNISALELNIPAEDLMERFVRGDRSRHSEGSGLGLSVAKSLTELQGGKFTIEIDGDLFKTQILFPMIQQDIPVQQDIQTEKADPERLSTEPLQVGSLQNEA